MYHAMAPSRQINPFEHHVSSDSCLDQVKKASTARTFVGPLVGLNRDKIVITQDRLLFVKHKRAGIKQEWVEVFHKDIRGIEINSPGQWPTWYAVMWYFPPWGLCGSHRLILGAPRCGIGMWLYRLTLGKFSQRTQIPITPSILHDMFLSLFFFAQVALVSCI